MNPATDKTDAPDRLPPWSAGAPCFHCAEPLPVAPLYATVSGRPRPVCCRGCQAVAELIDGAELQDFYRFREQAGPRPDDDDQAIQDQWSVYDRPQLRDSFVSALPGGLDEASILVEGMRCAACSWLIERSLAPLEGVQEVRVNPTTGRGLVRYDPQRIGPARLFARIARLGYRPHAAGAGSWEKAQRAERHRALRRLAVAGLGMMQVMTFAVSLYAGAFQGMETDIREFLRLVSLLVATPVAFYSGWPFFQGALRDLRTRSPGMDVPVSLAIGVAYLASVWNTLIGTGEVYFDSVTMFVFFLSLGRYLEMMARHRAGDTADALTRTVPRTAIRIDGQALQRVGANELQPGDLVLVRPGDAFPCDGVVIAGRSGVDESLITGETSLREREPGDAVLGGSSNATSALRVQVTATGNKTVIAGITRLLERAQSERPGLARLANSVAAWFVVSVLVVASLVAWYWYARSPELAMHITLSVLVVTCPCALSLATPAALTAATNHLARLGVLITRAHAVEAMAHSNRVIFDKTGTLTTGRLGLARARGLGGVDTAAALNMAAALERESSHPIASAFDAHDAGLAVTDTRMVNGRGIEARLAGRLTRIGREDFVIELSGGSVEREGAGEPGQIVIGDERGLLGRFTLEHQVRPEAGPTLQRLRRMGLAIELASGDSQASVAALATALSISNFHAALLPADKLSLLRRRQGEGDIVMMVGDGINDAPVLAGADVSVAMGSGAALAQTSADSILLADSLAPLADALETVRKTMRIIRQNIAWAVAYNATALPLAAAGLVEPWMAAIGMSSSSLLVVLNALRVGRGQAPRRAPAPEPVAAPAGQPA